VWHYIRKGYMDEANICITDFFTQQDSELDQLHHEICIASITSKQCQISPWADENAGLDLSPATPVTMQNHLQAKWHIEDICIFSESSRALKYCMKRAEVCASTFSKLITKHDSEAWFPFSMTSSQETSKEQ
jgi:hypothetical protein